MYVPKITQPSDYLDDGRLISTLQNTRKRILENPKAYLGNKETYAFDLYTLAGNAYKVIRESGALQKIKALLISKNDIQWFFLSGGYGIIHALEAAKKYQATFSQGIAYKKGIPYTTNLWRSSLPSICDTIFSKFQPEWVYVFGSRDYADFVKRTDFWREKSNIKMFESTGFSGPYWLAPKLNELIEAILEESVDKFNARYSKFTKQ